MSTDDPSPSTEEKEVGKEPYSFRDRPKVDYNPPPQLRRPPKANMALLDKIDQELPALLSYRSKCEPTQECEVTDAIVIVPTDPATKPISIAPPRNRKEALTSPWWMEQKCKVTPKTRHGP